MLLTDHPAQRFALEREQFEREVLRWLSRRDDALSAKVVDSILGVRGEAERLVVVFTARTGTNTALSALCRAG